MAEPETTLRAEAEELAAAVMAGDRRALARALTAVENATALAEPLLEQLRPVGTTTSLIGITGPPGAGKSTLIDALTTFARAAGRSVAVVAVDPSSPITGGSLLGDRIRMQGHAGDPDVFIRSMAARGQAGGVAAATVSASVVLAAAGFDLVFIETVGTGQGEVAIAAVADVTVVLDCPGAGDEVQALKAGLLEVADIVVVNKGDQPGAARTVSQLRAMLVTGRASSATHVPPDVLVTTATSGQGVGELLAAIDRRRAAADRDGRTIPGAWAETEVRRLLAERLWQRLRAADLAPSMEATLALVAEDRLDLPAAADRLLDLVLGSVRRSPSAGPAAQDGDASAANQAPGPDAAAPAEEAPGHDPASAATHPPSRDPTSPARR